MNKLIYVLFLAVFSLDWLSLKLGVLPRIMTWAPEVLSLAAVAVVVIYGATHRSVALGGRYFMFFFWFFGIITIAAVVSGVESTVTFAGLRIYLKYLPFFLLPLVYHFSERQFHNQLKFLLVLTLLQLPVALYQRLFKFSALATGDVVGGTLGASTSGVLSVYLACSIAILVAFYLKRMIGGRRFCLLLVCLFMPMTLNETKISVFILPFALVAPVVLLPSGYNKKRLLMSFATSAGIFLVAFTLLYSFFSDRSLVEWFSEVGVRDYLYKDIEYGDLTTREVGRFNSISIALEKLWSNGRLLTGVGIGNASPSFSEKFEGTFYKEYEWAEPTKVYLTRVLWELGLAGVLVYLYFFGIVFLDAMQLRTEESAVGAFALGWTAITVIIACSFVYLKTFDTNLFAYLFWFYSGFIASRRHRPKTVAKYAAAPQRLAPVPQRLRT